MDLTVWIEDIERRLDADNEQAIYDAWADFAYGKDQSAPFTPPLRKHVPSKLDWPHVNVNDALADEELMLLSQLERCHVALTSPSNMPIIMRANYGVGNIASMFGAQRFTMPYEMDTLPNVYPMGEAEVDALLDSPAPALTAGNCPHIFSIGEKLMDICAKYPKIGKFVRIDHPDCQGPMDNCELLWGSDIFYALYDDPDKVHALLRRLTDTIKAVLDKWYTIVPIQDGLTSYFGRLAPGGIVVRDDSAMNLSPDFFDEYIKPYDSELLAHYGGGIVHFCGKGDHFAARLAQMPNLSGVDMSQPHLNDMDKILTAIADKGINMYIGGNNYPLAGHDARRIMQY